jgi:hypothetical protein
MMIRPYSNVLLAVTGLLMLLSEGCAKVGRPTGGPMDLNPPQYVAGLPENRSTNFTGDKIEITFDEYIALKNQNKEIIISPPLKEKPLIRVREKDLRITLNNELIPLTTYTLNFGNGLVDLNESNPLPDFEFVFSTGPEIDSLSLTGKVVNAFDNKPEAEGGIFVMLYENLSDSAPLVEIPKYYGRANKNGLFAINNIHPDTFNVIALKDENNNLRYDPSVEAIAFLDTMLVINAENVIPQTYIKDTIMIITPASKPGRRNKQGNVQVEADTTIAPGKLINARDVSLYYFLEESDKVFLTSRSRESAESFVLTFSRPLFDSLQVSLLNHVPVGDWFMKEATPKNDSLTFWISDTLIASMDTLRLKLSYLTTDSAGRNKERIDTVNLKISSPINNDQKGPAGRKSRNDEADVKKKALPLTGSISNRGVQNLNRTIYFTSERPLHNLNPDSIEFYRMVDTLLVKQPFSCYPDTSSFRVFRLACKWEEECQYRLLLKPGTATDIYGYTNDSLAISFYTQQLDFYGKILLTLTGGQYPLIIQVLNERGGIVVSKKIMNPGLVSFDYLSPGKYNLKAIFDENDNGKWDTGDYLKHLQPEKIFLSGGSIQLRSNWDHEVSWKIND